MAGPSPGIGWRAAPPAADAAAPGTRWAARRRLQPRRGVRVVRGGAGLASTAPDRTAPGRTAAPHPAGTRAGRRRVATLRRVALRRPAAAYPRRLAVRRGLRVRLLAVWPSLPYGVGQPGCAEPCAGYPAADTPAGSGGIARRRIPRARIPGRRPGGRRPGRRVRRAVRWRARRGRPVRWRPPPRRRRPRRPAVRPCPRRRSAGTGSVARLARGPPPGSAGAEPSSGVAQKPQNRKPAGFSELHAGHVTDATTGRRSEVPQNPHILNRAGFSSPQFGQCTTSIADESTSQGPRAWRRPGRRAAPASWNVVRPRAAGSRRRGVVNSRRRPWAAPRPSAPSSAGRAARPGPSTRGAAGRAGCSGSAAR